MSLNDIQFPGKMIAGLYKDTLIELITPARIEQNKKATAQIHFLGENKKKILVVVKYADAVHLPDNQLSFLINLLGSCKLNLGDTAVLNFKNYSGKDFHNILSFFEAKTVFLFGVSPEEFGMPLFFPHFQIQNFKETTYLFSPALDEIENNIAQKRKLWNCLKKIFSL